MEITRDSSSTLVSGPLPTPPVPADLRQRPIRLTENARTVLQKRYLRRGEDGKPAEDEHEMFWRVAYNVALAEEKHNGDVLGNARKFYDMLTNLQFFPNSPTFTGAGTPLGQLAACFTADMRITTSEGLKRIADLAVDDLVLTHQGHYKPVTEVYQREYKGTLLKIKMKQTGTGLEVTPEHPVLTTRGWVKAGELKVGDLVAAGIPHDNWSVAAFDLTALTYSVKLEVQETVDAVCVRRPSTYQNSGRQAVWSRRFLEVTPDLGRLCGYYLSEGTLGPDERYIRFTVSKDETLYHEDITALLQKLFNVEPTIHQSNFGNWVQMDVYNRVVATWFRENFGAHSYGKRIPAWMQFADPQIQEQLLIGVLRGDGLFYEAEHNAGNGRIRNFRTIRLTLSNPSLIQQFWQICLRLGYDASIRPCDTTYVTPNARETASLNIPPTQGRELAFKTFGRWFSEADKRYLKRPLTRTENHVYFPIKSIEAEEFSGTVYNCEVQDDHTYVTEGMVVHNCFVLRIDDDMGRSESGIFQTLRDAALIQQTGGGNGFAFSNLRPKGSIVKSSNGQATGPVGFLRVYDQAFGEIAQGGCLTPDTLVFTEKGLLRLDEIVTHAEPGWRSHDLSVPTDDGIRQSTQAYNNGVVPVLRVITDAGIELTGTPNHKLKVMTADGAVWRRFDELQPGDALMVKLGQHMGQVQSLLQPVRQHGHQVMPEFPSLLNEEFAFFLGCMAGDGFVAAGDDDHRVGISVAHDSYLIDEMPALMQRLFGAHITVHCQQKDNDASVTYVMDNRAIKDFLILNNLTKARSTNAHIPRPIRQSSPQVVGAFLSGLFEADGTLSHGYPALISSSEALIREVATMLIGLGCPVRIHQQLMGEGHYGQAPMWFVRVNSYIGLQAWRKNIGCDSRSRFNACYTYEPDLARESSYTLPHASYWVEPVLAATALPQIDTKGRGTGRNLRASDPKLRKQLLRYTRGDRQLTISGYAQLTERSSAFAEHARPINDTWFITVNAVENVGESLTLDIEVQDNHTYLANGVITHNSRRGANMAVLSVNHPDIREFITSKTDESKITNFNISVGITDDFMRAVEADGDFELINPQDSTVWETIRAREIFELIVKQAHHNGEPGVLFLDAANRQNPVPHLYELESTNPCHRGTNLVHTNLGIVPIKDLVGRDFMATAPDGQMVRAIAFPTGIKPLFRVHFENGTTIDLTENHNLIASDGTKKAVRDLVPGSDEILLAEPKGSNLSTRVIEVEDLQIAEPVYNITVDHPSHQFYVNGIVSGNCGEQFLGPFENCCLGSINLVNVVTADRKVDWALLQKLTEDSTRFLDDVVTANKYVPAVPQLEKAAHAVRRIGLGIMGLGDLMYKLGVRYGSEEGQEFAGQIMEFVRFHAMRTSIKLAKKRGAFPEIKGSIYDPENLKWQPPKPLFAFSRDWSRPALDWSEIVDGLKKHGIRNGAQLTVAPTGTIATVSGCEAYGCEPVFALAYVRHVNDKGRDLQLQYTSPLFQKSLEEAGLNATQIKSIVEEVNAKGSCQDVAGVPEHVRHTFVVSSDITVEEHIRMQAAMQAFVDNAISKTVNAPHTATLKDVEQAYMLGWKLGCKGMTVYVTGSREKVVLETHATVQAKQKDEPTSAVAVTPAPEIVAAPPKMYGYLKKQRPRELVGKTYQVGTPLGKTYVTINENGEGRGQPFEIFTHTSKAGSETAAVSEAIGRLISLVLRFQSPISPRERLKEIIEQLQGIGGGRSAGFGAARVRSLPDGIAQVLQEYMEATEDGPAIPVAQPAQAQPSLPASTPTASMNGSTAPHVTFTSPKVNGDLCPECGEAAVVNEEGCRKCYNCGYSEC